MKGYVFMKKAEEALKAREVQPKDIINGSPTPQFVIDKKHRVIYWNRALERYSGIKASEVIGTNQQWRAFYPKKRPCLADLMVDGAMDKIDQWYKGKYRKSKLIKESYEVTDFLPKLGKGGTWMYFTVAPVRDIHGKPVGAVETLEDITERKQAEEALREEGERWSSLMKNTDDVIMIVNSQGIIQYINITIPPYSPEGTVGKKVYAYTPKEQHAIMRASLEKVFKTGKPDRYEISSNIPKIGIIWFSTKVVPIKHDRRVKNIIMISTDITKRKKAEEQTKKMNKELESKVEELERFTKLAVDRELKMVELKKELEALKNRTKTN